MRSKISVILLTILLILVVIVALGGSMGLHSLTLIDWWKPTILSAVIALPLTILLAKYLEPLTRQTLKYLEYPVTFILSFSIILVAFYSANYFLSDHSSGYEYSAPVVRKYSQVRTRTRRINRRAYREEKYTVYIVELEMKDGKIKKMEKTLPEYNKIKRGGSVRMIVEDGLFKIPVIKPIPKNQKNNNY